VDLPEEHTVAQALDRVRASELAPAVLTTIYLHDAEHKLSGSAPVVSLLRARAQARLAEIAEHEPVSVHTDADLPEVARTMTDYNLMTLPVVDEEQHVVGVITVDDVLELTLPPGWRRRFGLVSD
jgi:Mg/Co/Ni transporter MgtE